MTIAPLAPRHGFNGADLRYLRGAVQTLSDALGASRVAADQAVHPAVRALAARVTQTLTDDIGAVTALLGGWGDQEGVRNQASQLRQGPLETSGTSELRSCSGVEVDLRFLEILAAHTHTVLAGTREEMNEGFALPSRVHAEQASRRCWQELTALTVVQGELDPLVGPASAGGTPAPGAGTANALVPQAGVELAVPQAGVEPATFRLGGGCSIR